jgi:hypothetical protein
VNREKFFLKGGAHDESGFSFYQEMIFIRTEEKLTKDVNFDKQMITEGQHTFY